MIKHQRSVSAGPRSPTIQRFSAAHANSSAFSASANANEDWTKISDLAERRRIQNRIAQRNYRKKLKRRLEDLERRAGSASASPEPEQLQSSHRGDRDVKRTSTSPSVSEDPIIRYEASPEPSYGPYTSDHSSFMPIPNDRHLMTRPHPTFSYSTFGMPDAISAPYPHSPALSSYSIPSPGLHGLPNFTAGSYLSPRIISSAASTPNEPKAMKQEYFDQDFNSGYNYGFGAVAGYQEPGIAYTPDFSDIDPFDSFSNSVSVSPPAMWTMFQDTMPQSPPFLQL